MYLDDIQVLSIKLRAGLKCIQMTFKDTSQSSLGPGWNVTISTQAINTTANNTSSKVTNLDLNLNHAKPVGDSKGLPADFEEVFQFVP